MSDARAEDPVEGAEMEFEGQTGAESRKAGGRHTTGDLRRPLQPENVNKSSTHRHVQCVEPIWIRESRLLEESDGNENEWGVFTMRQANPKLPEGESQW